MYTYTCNIHQCPTITNSINSSLRIEYKLSLLCFSLRSFLIRLPSTFQNFTFTLPPSSSTLLQTPECSEYHPSKQSHVVSALSLTRIQLSGTNSLFLSTVLPLSALLNLPWKPFSFKYLFFSLIALICDWCVCAHTCLCVCVYAFTLYALNFDKYVFVENV